MREINVKEIADSVARLCIEANIHIDEDILQAFHEGAKSETSERGRYILEQLIENSQISNEKNLPICQDTGMAVIFIKAGQEVLFVGGDLYEAVNEGVRRGYKEGFLRCSVIEPIERKNTKDNTPAIIHFQLTKGDKVRVIVAPKGFGSENMSALKMLNPSDGIDGVKNFVLDTVKNAGSNPCPPIVVGVGIGGTMEKACLMAKEALTRPISKRNDESFWRQLEYELLEKINQTNIGPAGFGGKTTALAVNVEAFPTHIAGLPVAVNIGCHVTRHREVTL